MTLAPRTLRYMMIIIGNKEVTFFTVTCLQCFITSGPQFLPFGLRFVVNNQRSNGARHAIYVRKE